jgi:hypothetical protein
VKQEARLDLTVCASCPPLFEYHYLITSPPLVVVWKHEIETIGCWRTHKRWEDVAWGLLTKPNFWGHLTRILTSDLYRCRPFGCFKSQRRLCLQRLVIQHSASGRLYTCQEQKFLNQEFCHTRTPPRQSRRLAPCYEVSPPNERD